MSSRHELRFARALKYVPHMIQTIYFVRYIPKVSRVGVVLRAGKSTFRTQNDTDCANFRYTVDKKPFYFNLSEFTNQARRDWGGGDMQSNIQNKSSYFH